MPSTDLIKNGINERNLKVGSKREREGAHRGASRKEEALKRQWGDHLTRAVCSTVFLRTVLAGWSWRFPRAVAYQAWRYTGTACGATQPI